MVFQIPETIEKKLSMKLKIAMLVGSVVVLVGATFAGYYLGQKKNAVPPQVVQNNDSTVPPTDTVSEIVPDPVTVPDTENSTEPKKYVFPTTSLPQEIDNKIVWLAQPKQMVNLNWFKNDTETSYQGEYGVNKYYEVGNFEYEGEKGKVILFELGGEGMGPPPYFHAINFKKEIILLTHYPDLYIPEDDSGYSDLDIISQLLTPESKARVKLNTDFRISSLDFPKSIKGSNDRQALNLLGAWHGLSQQFGYPKNAVNKKLTGLSDPKFGNIYTSVETGGFYLYGAHGTEATYVLEPDFFNKDNSLAQIIWNDGSWNGYEYAYRDQGGCGSLNLASVVTSTDVTVRNDLEVVGKTSKGDLIYELKDKNHRLFKEFYDVAYFPGSSNYDSRDYNNKLSYEEFVTLRPVIFWIDPFGRIIKLTNKRFVMQAECGKPVIYLYPEKTSVVDVKVEPQGGMTVSDPFYDGGWQVKAEPNGQLTETKSGKQYPYLFWEGRGGLYQTPEKGFLIKKENIAKELPEKLTQLGLNANETKDFMEFWYPRMQVKPYYFVTFLGTQQMNQLAPLTINPRPDTVVRILMDFTPLDKPIDVLPLSLGRTPERKGFTVIEWGGVIR